MFYFHKHLLTLRRRCLSYTNTSYGWVFRLLYGNGHSQSLSYPWPEYGNLLLRLPCNLRMSIKFFCSKNICIWIKNIKPNQNKILHSGTWTYCLDIRDLLCMLFQDKKHEEEKKETYKMICLNMMGPWNTSKSHSCFSVLLLCEIIKPTFWSC